MLSDGDEAYRVIFALDVDKLREPIPGAIVVSPTPSTWNDFGFQIRIQITVFPPVENAQLGDQVVLTGFFGYIMDEGQLGDSRTLHELLTSAPSGRIEGSELPTFFTMLPDLAAYRSAVSLFGPEEARMIFRGLHDIVEAEDGPNVPSWLRPATESRVFRRAFLRTSEAYFAWKNAGMFLQGTQFEEVGRISDELRIRFQLAGRPNEHILRFQFAVHETVLPKRFAIVIGENGVGKSQTLGRIADAAIRGLSTLTDGNGERPSFNRILAFYSTAFASAHCRLRGVGAQGFGIAASLLAALVTDAADRPLPTSFWSCPAPQSGFGTATVLKSS